jgi:hypothetical protein
MATCKTFRHDHHDRKNWERDVPWSRGSKRTTQNRFRKLRSEASVIHTKARENRKRDITRGRDYKRSPYGEQHTLESYNLFKGESTSSVMEHIQQGHCYFFGHLDEEFRQNPEVSLCAVRQCGLTLKDVSDEHKYDPEIVLAAVSQNGISLKYAPTHFRYNFKIVLAAVSQNGYALRYSLGNLNANLEIVLATVRKDYMAWV